MTLEREFESRYDVIKWMLDLQLNRRSPNKKKRTYVIGRRYLVEKNENGRPVGSTNEKKLYQNDKVLSETHKRIAAQLSIGSATVTRAAEFTLAVDTIVRVTGIRVNPKGFKWMLDLQLNRRSPNKKKRTYVIGRRYLVEKNEWGVYDHNKEKSAQNAHSKTAEKIGDQLSINQATVRRAAEFTLAVDTIVRVTGIKVNDILSG